MRLQQVLDELLEILQAESEGKHFKSLGALRKSEFQNNKSEDDKFLRSDMYSGIKGDSEAAKKGHETRKKNGTDKIAIEKARKTRKEWYENPENKKKFMNIVKKKKNKEIEN